MNGLSVNNTIALYTASCQIGDKLKTLYVWKKPRQGRLEIKNLAGTERYCLEQAIFQDGNFVAVVKQVRVSGNVIANTLDSFPKLEQFLAYFGRQFQPLFEQDKLARRYLQPYFFDLDYWLREVKGNERR